jgi:hypothetical protein
VCKRLGIYYGQLVCVVGCKLILAVCSLLGLCKEDALAGPQKSAESTRLLVCGARMATLSPLLLGPERLQGTL